MSLQFLINVCQSGDAIKIAKAEQLAIQSNVIGDLTRHFGYVPNCYEDKTFLAFMLNPNPVALGVFKPECLVRKNLETLTVIGGTVTVRGDCYNHCAEHGTHLRKNPLHLIFKDCTLISAHYLRGLMWLLGEDIINFEFPNSAFFTPDGLPQKVSFADTEVFM